MSCRNALRHGLAASTQQSEAGLSSSTQAIVRALGFGEETATAMSQSRSTLHRVRVLRYQALAKFLQSNDVAALAGLRGTERYERAAWARQQKLLRNC